MVSAMIQSIIWFRLSIKKYETKKYRTFFEFLDRTFLPVGFGNCFANICFATFRVPTDSMLPVIQPGDQLLVNKLVVGPRLFNLRKAMRGESVEISRLPGIRKIKRNDILVFHNPYPRNKEHMEMHLLKYYVKRCLALLGDTIAVCFCLLSDLPQSNVKTCYIFTGFLW